MAIVSSPIFGAFRPKEEEILVWILPEMLGQDILDALNNFRELFYDAGVPSLIFMTPAALDDVIWKATRLLEVQRRIPHPERRRSWAGLSSHRGAVYAA